MFPVAPEKEQALLRRMAAMGIAPDDLEERFVRSSGSGGQNVNKVATCVVLRHVPTGLTVKCQEARTQAMNRFLARRLLVEKLDERRRGAESRAAQEAARVRRQKRRRSRRAKEKVLAAKREQSEKKASRRRPALPEET